MEYYVIYNTETLSFVGTVDASISGIREAHDARSGADNSISTNTITTTHDNEMILPFMISVVAGVASYDPTATPENEPEIMMATVAVAPDLTALEE